MPIVRPYPIGEVSPQPIPNVAPNVPAAGDINLFGGNQARDLQIAGQNLGQASDSLAALYQRHAQDANDTRVQDLNNRFLDGQRETLSTGPDAYYKLTGIDAIHGADGTTAKLTSLKDQYLGQTANPYQRQKLRPILDAHLAASATGIMRHTVEQQDVYSRGVASSAIATSRAQATADPAMMANAVFRAEGAARAFHAGQPPEAIEAGVRAAGGSIIAGVIGDRLARNDPMGVTLFRQHADRLDDGARRTLGAAAETLSNTLDAAAWLRERSAALRTPAPTGDQTLDAVNTASASPNEPPPVTDSLYADLRRHLTTGGPGGGPAVTPPPATITSRLIEEQQDAVIARTNRAIAGIGTTTDPQTFYAIHQGLTGENAGERERWATKNLVQFMGRLSDDDLAALEKLQTVVRKSDGGAEQRRLQAITRMANDTLRAAGIDPTPRPDAPPGSEAEQAARFHLALQDELSAFESRGGKPTEAEAYGIVNGLKDAAIKDGWIKVSDTSPTVPDGNRADNTLPDSSIPTEQQQRSWVTLDFDRLRRMREQDEQTNADTGGFNGAPATEPEASSREYQTADAQAREIVARQTAQASGSQGGGAPAIEPSPGSTEYQTAEKEARPVVEQQEAENREDDRATTRWLTEKRDKESSPKLPPELADRLSPAEREELENLAVAPDAQTNPEVYDRILANLLNYNSQVRLKWAREPLFRYRKFLSAEDFAKLARLQSWLDPETGQVSGFAPTPADLVAVYDWLAPEPDLEYGSILPIKHTTDWKQWDWALPSSARSFLKGMLDLVSAGHRGEFTTDALELFMTLQSIGGRTFGPHGGAETLAAGGKRHIPKPPPSLTAEQRRLYYFSVRHSLEWSSERTQRVLANLDNSAREFIGTFRAGSVNREFPKEFEGLTLRQAFGVDSTKLRKLLNDLRFEK